MDGAGPALVDGAAGAVREGFAFQGATIGADRSVESWETNVVDIGSGVGVGGVVVIGGEETGC